MSLGRKLRKKRADLPLAQENPLEPIFTQPVKTTSTPLVVLPTSSSSSTSSSTSSSGSISKSSLLSSSSSSSSGSKLSTSSISSTSKSSILSSSTKSTSVVKPVITETSTTSSAGYIFLTTFNADFPVETYTSTAQSNHVGYVFVHNQLEDSTILFVIFLAAFFLFTACIIRLTRWTDSRFGKAKEDTMLSDDMRWAEGREVIEKRVVWQVREHDRVSEDNEPLMRPGMNVGSKPLRPSQNGRNRVGNGPSKLRLG
ncbi:hypothetical protein M231_02501 [Tremella mesenterica]|uniref:Uncharacterized protein n=1 Tax=Tremella mesenterica TaxID=5217 RepID=A0A4V1M4F9_TREME|nr:uncharacterized protein TREMEDRAFT_64608 [Tremella mesenterica DSM 1558]EIW67357.1 hypothetical protein TREMEDRAFT_64608 [Tremella mesenterica DSM 1558]RXK40227.1 hypothetical protein M231_02501 [Tremella mesenterica]